MIVYIEMYFVVKKINHKTFQKDTNRCGFYFLNCDIVQRNQCPSGFIVSNGNHACSNDKIYYNNVKEENIANIFVVVKFEFNFIFHENMPSFMLKNSNHDNNNKNTKNPLKLMTKNIRNH